MNVPLRRIKSIVHVCMWISLSVSTFEFWKTVHMISFLTNHVSYFSWGP
jgi:hypothetical protein